MKSKHYATLTCNDQVDDEQIREYSHVPFSGGGGGCGGARDPSSSSTSGLLSTTGRVVANNDQWLLLTSVVLLSLTAVYQLLVAESVTGVVAPMGIRRTVADRRVHFNGGGGGPEQCRPRSVWHLPEKNRDGKISQRPCRERRQRASATGQRFLR